MRPSFQQCVMCSDQYFKNGVIVLLHGPWSLSVWVADVDLHLNNGPPGFSHGSQIQTHPCTMGPPICWGGHPSGNPSKPHLLINYKITVCSRKTGDSILLRLWQSCFFLFAAPSCSIMCKWTRPFGGQTAGGPPKASPRPSQPLFAVPALRELERCLQVSIVRDAVTIPTVCFSGALWGSPEGVVSSSLRPKPSASICSV